MSDASEGPGLLRRVGTDLSERVRKGWIRARGDVLQSLQLTAAAIGAFVFAEAVLGHTGPIFAATAATVALGFSKGGRRYRRVLEVGIGCTLGIALAEVLIHLIGTGTWQAAVVMLTSILLARFLDSGVLFTTQMALQSLLVVVLPPSGDGAFARSTDAMVGGIFALIMVYLVPSDPRRAPRTHVRRLTTEISGVLREAAEAIVQDDATSAWHCLVRARRTQSEIDSVNTSLEASQEIASASPVHRRHRSEVDQIASSIRYLDLAARDSRVLVRRLAGVINHVTLAPEAITSISECLVDMADSVSTVGSALAVPQRESRESYLRQARNELITVAQRLHPQDLGVRTLEGQALVLLMRPLVVDLLEATNMEHEDATAHLPALDDWDRM
ncbi:aromatic acid exporter family protein [Kocuria palustris]|uniref:FUSC family protein n=1 Tax=Kocuria palustris TaxID=71999 RepID=UPI0011A3CAA0|nr:FUSC family protein [Kocuria palustris]